MPDMKQSRPRWTIGQFSRMTRLSARMLRHYDRLGLLRPSDVDPWNGYRYYSEAELGPAAILRRLRDAGVGLDDIAQALPALLAQDDATWRPVLARHLGRLEAEAAVIGHQREITLALLDYRQEPTMSTSPATVTTQTIPAHVVIALRDVIPAYAEEPRLFERLEPALAELLGTGALHRTGDPCGATFFDDGYVEHDVDVEVWEVVDTQVEVPVPLTCRAVPERTVLLLEHAGAYDRLSEAHAELVGYIGRTGATVTGPAFERYLVGPAHNPDPTAWRTQVCLPVRL